MHKTYSCIPRRLLRCLSWWLAHRHPSKWWQSLQTMVTWRSWNLALPVPYCCVNFYNYMPVRTFEKTCILVSWKNANDITIKHTDLRNSCNRTTTVFGHYCLMDIIVCVRDINFHNFSINCYYCSYNNKLCILN